MEGNVPDPNAEVRAAIELAAAAVQASWAARSALGNLSTMQLRDVFFACVGEGIALEAVDTKADAEAARAGAIRLEVLREIGDSALRQLDRRNGTGATALCDRGTSSP